MTNMRRRNGQPCVPIGLSRGPSLRATIAERIA